MLELIQRAIDKNIKIDRLHSMGGRTEVLEAFERRNINRTEIYIIDGDLYMLFENHNFQKGLVVEQNDINGVVGRGCDCL